MDMVRICVMLPDFQKFQWCQLAAAHHMLAYHKIQETFLKQFALASVAIWTIQLKVASIWSNM